MDFSLLLSPQPTELQLAEKRGGILATNALAFTLYGIQLTEDEAAMIVESGTQAQNEESLVEFGGSITPRIIHWFLPTGYLGLHYAADVAQLTAAFYHIKGRLLAICEEAGDMGCTLSDNAILYYMYRLFTNPGCAGDIDRMTDSAEQIICGGMQRLLELRRQQRKANQSVLAGDPEYRSLYADVLEEEMRESDYELRDEEERYDDTYSGMMEGVWDGATGFGDPERIRGDFAEELEEALRRDPALLIPGRMQEAEWDSMAEQWEEEDAAASAAADAARKEN